MVFLLRDRIQKKAFNSTVLESWPRVRLPERFYVTRLRSVVTDLISNVDLSAPKHHTSSRKMEKLKKKLIVDSWSTLGPGVTI